MQPIQWIPKRWRVFLKQFAPFRYLARRLNTQITRERIDDFLEIHQTTDLTLDVGAASRRYRNFFPNTIAGDIAYDYVISDDVTVRYATIDVQYDAHHMPFSDACVSTVLCTEVLEHCVNPQQVIKELHRVLRPGGKLILTTRYAFPLHEVPHDYFRFTRYGLELLCSDFHEVSVEEEENTMETVQVLLDRIGRQTRWRVPFVGILFKATGKMFALSYGLLKQEYGDASRIRPDKGIIAAGYLVIAIK